MIKCLIGGYDGYQNFNTPLPDPQVDSLPVEISLTFPKELYAFELALDVICPDSYDWKLDYLRKDILCPYRFDTHHAYESSSEDLIKKIEKWAEDEGIRLFNCGYIKGHRWLDEDNMEKYNTLHWQSPDEETAFLVALIWNGKE